MLLPVLLSVLYGAVLLWQINRMLRADDWVRHSIEVLTVSTDGLRHIQAEESALRGYLLTHSSFFSDQFQHEDQTVDSMLQRLHTMIADNPSQTVRLDSVMQSYWQWQASAKHALANAEEGRTDTNVLRRSVVMDAMRALFQHFSAEEEALYSSRRSQFTTGTTWLTVLIIVISIAIGFFVGLHARRQTRRFVTRFGQIIDEATSSRDLLETTLLSIGDAIIVTDSNEHVTMMNRRAEELSGWAIGDAKGRHLDDVFRVVHEISRTKMESPIARAIRDRKVIMLANHAVLLARTGLELPVEDSAAPIHNSKHDVIGAVLVFRDVSERRESQRAAEEREREFRTLIENSPDLIMRFAPDLKIEYVNPAVETVLGIVPQMLIGRRFREAGLPEEIYAPWEESVRKIFQTGRQDVTELQYQSVRGLRSYHARLVPQSGEQGVEHVAVILRDITDLKQTSDRLRESDRRFRALIQNTPDAFVLLRSLRDAKTRAITDFVIEDVNPTGAEFLAVAKGSVGQRLKEISQPESFERSLKLYSETIESGESKELDTQAPIQEDSPFSGRWFHAKLVPIGDVIAVIISDVTARIQTETALRQSELRYRRLVETASEGIFSTDKEGRFTYANPHIRNLAGYTDDDVTKYYFTDFVAPDQKSRVQRHFYRQFLSKTPQSQIDAAFVTKQGERKWLSIATSLLFTESGEVEGFDCIATDVSDRIQLEAKLERTERELAETKR
jgi:PAS domain S-box-containing protein